MNNLICPKCKTLLSSKMVITGLLWKCEACSGTAVNLAVLRRHLKSDTVRELWRTAMTESKPSDRSCPSCGNALREFASRGDDRRISLDLCKTCQLIWFDKNELEAFPKSTKIDSSVIEQSFALAKMQFAQDLENEQRTAEKYIATAMDIIILVIRMLLKVSHC